MWNLVAGIPESTAWKPESKTVLDFLNGSETKRARNEMLFKGLCNNHLEREGGGEAEKGVKYAPKLRHPPCLIELFF